MSGYWDTVAHELNLPKLADGIAQAWHGIIESIVSAWASVTHSVASDWHALIHFVTNVGWGGWIVCGVFGLIVYGQISQYRDFRRLPTLLQYLAAHPDCQTPHGIRCCSCHSGSIRSWGLHGRDDSSRYFLCNHCNRVLYRTG